jgi:two-component system NarL family sensor kinase
VAISLRGHRSGATLRIDDNGHGISGKPKSSGEQKGIGLRNMEERIEQLGGTLNISSSGNGTTIEAHVPLSRLLSPSAKSASSSYEKAAE